MKFEIKHRWSGEILFSAETDTFKAAVELAVKSEADLSEADLSWANLSEADLSEANLSEADLSWANLSEADLSWANLSEANLSEANLSWANLSEANLSWANLSEADPRCLRHIKHDIWGVLMHAIPEIPALRQALLDGKVNGSAYEGECACLVGTIANARKCDLITLKTVGIQIDSSSMAERWFMGIQEGDTPKNNSAAKLVVEWIDEFTTLLPKL